MQVRSVLVPWGSPLEKSRAERIAEHCKQPCCRERRASRGDFPVCIACCICLLVFPIGLSRIGWTPRATRSSQLPLLNRAPGDVDGLIGTTIAPWQFFYYRPARGEESGARQYPQAARDVLVRQRKLHGVVFFIIVCTARTLYVSGHRDITMRAQAAQAVIPLAGRGAVFFSLRLLNASLFAASICRCRPRRDLRRAWFRGGTITSSKRHLCKTTHFDRGGSRHRAAADAPRGRS